MTSSTRGDSGRGRPHTGRIAPLRRFGRRTTVLLAAGALALGAAACGEDEEQASGEARPPESSQRESSPVTSPGQPTEAPTEVVGGTTALQLDGTTRRLLEAAGVDVSPIGAARSHGDDLVFPIVTGDLDIDSLSGRLQHDGGLRFSAGGRDVEARNFVIDPRREVLTADVGGRRVPLLSLDLGKPRVPQTGDVIVVPGSASTLAAPAVPALNDRLGVDVFRTGLRLGKVTIRVQRP